jgi:hypothetical protein
MVTKYLIDPEVERANRTRSAAITLGIVISILLVAFIIRSRAAGPVDLLSGGGVEVQFGYSDVGLGPEEPSPSPAISDEAVAQSTEASDAQIQGYTNSPEPSLGSSTPKTTTQATTSTTPAFKPKAVYSGPSGIGAGSGSEGNRPGTGNMGQPDGGEEGVYVGNPGSGGTSTGRGLGDRGGVGKLQLQQFHQVQETLIVDLYVLRDGTISRVEVKGGTLVDPTLKSRIVAQIKRSKLNPDPKAPEVEILKSQKIIFKLQ